MNLTEFREILEDCQLELLELEYDTFDNDYTVVFNTRTIRRLGRCSRKGTGNYTIELNKTYADVEPIEKVKDTIMHELIHSVNGCMNHDGKWKDVVKEVNEYYDYHISRLTQATSAYANNVQAKYSVICESCGRIIHKSRACKLTKYPYCYRCQCGGGLKVTQNY